MKRSAFLIVLLVGSICATAWRLTASGVPETSLATNPPAGPPMSRIDQEKAAWQQQVRRLEKLGEVPKTASTAWNMPEWAAAEQTSWWGKPLDPERFWKGRVLWLDASAQDAALRHGRQFPPPPYDDPTLHGYDERDAPRDVGGGEGPRLIVYSNDKEDAFWDKFSKTHPIQPKEIERKQSEIARDVMLTHEDRLSPSTERELSVLGYPTEAFVHDALFWSYVLEKRREYRNELSESPQMTNNNDLAWLQLKVNSTYLTQPPDTKVLKLANTWKIAYLQRLSREKVDQSYINAYLKAWNLKPGEVFTNAVISPQPTR